MSKKLGSFFKNKFLKYVNPLWRGGVSDDQGRRVVDSLEEDNLPQGCFYLFDQILIIPFPSQQRITQLAKFLNSELGSQYTIFNLSEQSYSHSSFDGQVVDYTFPGLPNPPLDVIFAICNSIKAWCLGDEKCVAVIHCQATHSRSALLMSCFLAFMSMKYNHPLHALTYFCEYAKLDDETLLLPSQNRYLNYFDQVLHGFRVSCHISSQPSPHPLQLQRIILNGLPNLKALGYDPPFRPYFQIFKADKLIFTDLKEGKKPDPVYESDLCVSTNCNIEIEGDILVRVRHFASDNVRVPMFRVFFHTYFVDPQDHLIRFTKNQIDGAHHNWAWPDELFIDMIVTAGSEKSMEESKLQLWETIYKSADERKRKKKRAQQGDDVFILEEEKGLPHQAHQQEEEEEEEEEEEKQGLLQEQKNPELVSASSTTSSEVSQISASKQQKIEQMIQSHPPQAQVEKKEESEEESEKSDDDLDDYLKSLEEDAQAD